MTIAQNLNCLRQRIAQTQDGGALLIAVSKQQSIEAIQQVYALGVRDFAESYVQEGVEKIRKLNAKDITWHFIGRIQSNKAKLIAAHFDWVHGVDNLASAQSLSQYRPLELGALNLCVQINLVGEQTKAGISPEEAQDLALQLSALPHVQLRGLMTILPQNCTQEEQYALFCRLAQLKKKIANELSLSLDTLSMGMSGDWMQALQAGSTMLRIGGAIFGPRQA
jgi:pyridoxal phosphate enzyme (YggS family)